MAWLERLDRRVGRSSAAVRWPYAFIKWSLVVLGAYCLAGYYISTWGWATIWLVGGPAVHGFIQGWPKKP